MHKVYWWRATPNHPIPANWGDRLNGMLPTWLDVKFGWRPPEEADLVVLGSILEHLPTGWSGTVCGAGKLHPDSHVDLSAANVLALRGRLTRDSVVLSPQDRANVVLGDPGLLVPYWVRQWPAKYDLGVIPHWSDDQLAKRFPYGHLIRPTGRPEDVVAEIAKCKRIISSSLHGLVVSDAYGIPRQAELFPNAHKEGGDFKHRDYMSIYYEEDEEIDVHFGEMWLAPHHIVERVQVELAAVLASATDAKIPPSPVPAPPPDIRHPDEHCPQISILMPFRHSPHDIEHRERAFNWLSQFWKSHLPSVEIIVGHDPYWPYSKAVAVNNAAEKARGRIFVVLDADAFMDPAVIQRCADNMEAAVARGKRLWYIPYLRLYRLSETISSNILNSDPHDEYSIPSSLPPDWREEGVADNSANYGYLYGALIQMMPREAFFMAGGMDPRFRGWGSEDASLLRALDTLYCQHEVSDENVLHIYHVRSGRDWKTRRWEGQMTQANSRLAQRYAQATGEYGFMYGLTRERLQPVEPPPCVEHHSWWWRFRQFISRFISRLRNII